MLRRSVSHEPQSLTQGIDALKTFIFFLKMDLHWSSFLAKQQQQRQWLNGERDIMDKL